MKKVLIRIFKELGIFIVMLVILVAVTIAAFYKQVPYSKEIPVGEKYVNIDKNEYSVSSTDRLQNITAITITHEANNNQIVAAENDVRIETGKATPFGSIYGSTDLPSERVGSSIVISDSEGNTANVSGDAITYPETDNSSNDSTVNDLEKDIDDIGNSENESAESRFDRRTEMDGSGEKD